jgi:hypothetical protein
MPTLLLQEGVGHGGERDVPMPAGITAPLEVVESEFVLELLVLLLDRPTLVRNQTSRLSAVGGQVPKKYLRSSAAHRPLREQPDPAPAARRQSCAGSRGPRQTRANAWLDVMCANGTRHARVADRRPAS